MENRNYLIKSLVTRLVLIFMSIIAIFLLITFPIDIFSNFSIYNEREEYKVGRLKVEDINTDSYGSSYIFADGIVDNVKTSVSLGLERDVKIQDYYEILYKPDGNNSFLITTDFKFIPLNYLYYGIIETLCIPLFLLIIFKTYKYFKNGKTDF